jgi:hypothetical protein
MHERLSPRLLLRALPGAVLVVILAIAGTAMPRAQAPDSAQTPTATDNSGADEKRSEAPTAVVADGVADGAADEQREGPLEDYEASEQISEDLSVSFPVDI